MRNTVGALRKKTKAEHMRSSVNGNKVGDIEKEANITEWITLFRRNWEIYVEMILQIPLKPFQKILIHLMGVSDIIFAIASRGLSKSFMASLGAVVKMLLYPYSEVVVTASTIPQAGIIVEEKIRGELIKKLSPYLQYLYAHDYLIITNSDEGYKITCTLNGSTMRVLPCLDSSRGHRATFIIYEEARLLKKNIIDSVFDKMSHPRQAVYYVNNEEYQTKRWTEECQFVYITSAGFKYEWFWNQFKKCVTGYYNDKKTRYNIFAGDIFLSIDNGLKTWGDYRKSKKMTSELQFTVEDLNTMIGEAADAFFTYKSFKENQTIESSYAFPSLGDRLRGTYIPNKEDMELRIVGVDYAFANTTSGTKNDNTIILCMRGLWRNNHFERYVDYIEGHEASDSDGAALRAREIWEYYYGDIFVPD